MTFSSQLWTSDSTTITLSVTSLLAVRAVRLGTLGRSGSKSGSGISSWVWLVNCSSRLGFSWLWAHQVSSLLWAIGTDLFVQVPLPVQRDSLVGGGLWHLTQWEGKVRLVQHMEGDFFLVSQFPQMYHTRFISSKVEVVVLCDVWDVSEHWCEEALPLIEELCIW